MMALPNDSAIASLPAVMDESCAVVYFVTGYNGPVLTLTIYLFIQHLFLRYRGRFRRQHKTYTDYRSAFRSAQIPTQGAPPLINRLGRYSVVVCVERSEL